MTTAALRAVALIDGEHYAARRARGARRAAVRVGRRDPRRRHREAARRRADYGVPLVESFGDAEVVVDLSDEPVLGAGGAVPLGVAGARRRAAVRRRRLPLRPARVRADRPAVDRRDRHRQARGEDRGLGAPRARCSRATATSSSSRWAAAGRAEPELIERPPSIADLVALSRSGRHAASDHLEIAAISGVPTIGCRRAGGGLAGQVVRLERLAGRAARRGASSPDVVVFDGSGSAIPPIAADRRVLVVGPGTSRLALRHVPPPRLRSRRRGRLRARRRGAGDAAAAAARAARGARRRLHRGRRSTSGTSTPTSSTSRAPRRPRGARGRARAARGRHVPRRAEGGRDRRRRRARARPRAARRARGERRRRRRGSTRRCSRSLPASRGGVMQPRYGEPLPLGEPGGLPYSKGMMARALIAAGVSSRARLRARDADRARPRRARRPRRRARAARGARRRGARRGGGRAGRRAAAPLAALHSLDLPIVLLVGGATGTGKSTVATEAAHRLGITRVTSTDFIRQTMRAFFSRRVHAVGPLLELRGRRRVDETGDPTIAASSSRRATCSSASRRRSSARSPRAGRWRSRASTSSRGSCPAEIDGALVVHAVLAIDEPEVHRTHFHVRDAATGGVRAMDKYLDQLDEIRAHPGLDRRARRAQRRAGDRELEPRTGDRVADRARAALGRAARAAAVTDPAAAAAPAALVSCHADARGGARSAARGRGSRARHGHRRARAALRRRGRRPEGEGRRTSLTSMGCPAGAMIQEDIERVVGALPAGRGGRAGARPSSRPGHPERMSEDAKFILGF